MAQMPQVFVPSDKEDSGFQVIAKGWRIGEVVKSEVKPTKNKEGTIMVLAFRILEGKYKGRIIYTNYNIVNKNETTVKIAEGQIKSLCEALGIDELQDTDELHKQEVGIYFEIEAGSANWPDKNKATKFKPSSEVELEDDEEEDENPFDGFDDDAKEETVDLSDPSGPTNPEIGEDAEAKFDDDIPF